jgi:hypothetical protein
MLKIKIILLLISLFTMLPAFSCNSSETKSKINDKKNVSGDNFNPFFPLKEGNKWVYINEGPRDESELFTVEAKDVKKVDGGIQLKVSTFPYFTKDNEERSLVIKTNGEIEINNYMGTTGVFIPSPDDFKIGYKWSFGNFQGYVQSKADHIDTEDGVYTDCYYILMTDGFTFSFEMWFKKDTGIVKWGANRTNPPQLKSMYYVLKEHTLN